MKCLVTLTWWSLKGQHSTVHAVQREKRGLNIPGTLWSCTTGGSSGVFVRPLSGSEAVGGTSVDLRLAAATARKSSSALSPAISTSTTLGLKGRCRKLDCTAKPSQKSNHIVSVRLRHVCICMAATRKSSWTWKLETKRGPASFYQPLTGRKTKIGKAQICININSGQAVAGSCRSVFMRHKTWEVNRAGGNN